MRIPERDVTYIVLSVYLRLSIDIHWTGSSPIGHKVNIIQLKTFELELDFAEYTGWLKKSKLLILAVNEINASHTRVSFAKFIPKLVEKTFDMCSIVPNYSFSILKFVIKILSSLLILPIITIWNIILN